MDIEVLQERYELMKERVLNLQKDASFCGKYADYVAKMAAFLGSVYEVYEAIRSEGRQAFALSDWQSWDDTLYADIMEPAYQNSYANPDVSVAAFGEAMGQRLCFLYTELRALIPAAYAQNLQDLVIYSELFVEIETILEQGEETPVSEVQSALYAFERDYSEVIVEQRLQSQVDASLDFAAGIIENSDFSDLSYLYYYGEHIGENEIQTARYLNGLSDEALEAMAFTYTDGYREGFEIAGIDLQQKQKVNIRYHIGFEPMVRAAIHQFAELGLKPVIYPAAVRSLDKRMNLRIGYTATPANKQYEYDHRFDNALYLDKAFAERKLEVLAAAYEKWREPCLMYAGPACIETFGESDFEPVSKDTACSLTPEQQELSVKLQSQSSQLANRYMPQDKTSYTIIAYPLPQIGSQYEAIFEETVRVNNLDKSLYRQIQQHLIDALDEAAYVLVEGAGKNVTNMRVMLHVKQDSEHETNFENCLADVNIPVGEVFTSPKLTGTSGTLHVSSVFLDGLCYRDLKLTFADGMVVDYDCANFETRQENRAFIEENLLRHRQTLPIGEFAIGTNTTAYVMARRFDILHKLPILIVEKMGPHFAVGDTCYSHSEDLRLYNPDGKEIVAKENECSKLRHTDPQKAYFNIHTDITIPYEEIGRIAAVRPDQSQIVLLQNGRFVLPGTQELNLPDMDKWLTVENNT